MTQEKFKFQTISPKLLACASIASGLCVYSAVSDMAVSERGQFSLMVFVVGLVVSIPLGVLISLILRLAIDRVDIRRMLMVRPVATRTDNFPISTVGFIEYFTKRLGDSGFSFSETRESPYHIEICFEVKKRPEIIGFRDHAFSGTAIVRKVSDSEVLVESKLILGDIAVIETGEEESLSAYLHDLLWSDGREEVKILPFTLFCGLSLNAFLVSALLLPLPPGLNSQSVFLSLALSAGGLIAIGMFHISKSPRGCYGYRYGAVGLAALLIVIASCLIVD
jgi:hypothetical protein